MGFIEEMENWKSPVLNWSRMARKYSVKCKEKIVKNGGQVLSNYAMDNGIDIYKLNKHLRLSGRDHLFRIRRSKKR